MTLKQAMSKKSGMIGRQLNVTPDFLGVRTLVRLYI